MFILKITAETDDICFIDYDYVLDGYSKEQAEAFANMKYNELLLEHGSIFNADLLEVKVLENYPVGKQNNIN